MALEQVPMWRVICDRCGANAQEDGEFAAWGNHGSAYDEATSHDWLVIEQGDWCPDCTLKDADGELIPNPHPLPDK
jgi:hypothetical protein